MDLDNIECVSSSDGLEDDEIHHNHPHHHNQYSLKPHSNVIISGGGGLLAGIAPATSVHELLECPVCTNSMYPPIHQVWFLFCLIWCLVLLILGVWG